VPAWLLWSLAAVALTVGEIATPGLFYLGPVALAAVASAIVAAAGGGWAVDLVVFAGASAASLGLLRPVARRHVRMPLAIRTGSAKLVGEKATVVERVDGAGGRVKIGGEIWSARAFDAGQVLEPGLQVEVVQIDGATALVYE
jgi:membrane protein implicated in regulation of membrane protease activity